MSQESPNWAGSANCAVITKQRFLRHGRPSPPSTSKQACAIAPSGHLHTGCHYLSHSTHEAELCLQKGGGVWSACPLWHQTRLSVHTSLCFFFFFFFLNMLLRLKLASVATIAMEANPSRSVNFCPKRMWRQRSWKRGGRTFMKLELFFQSQVRLFFTFSDLSGIKKKIWGLLRSDHPPTSL